MNNPKIKLETKKIYGRNQKVLNFKIALDIIVTDEVEKDCNEIPLDKAIQLAKLELERYASSNDGSEVLLNAEPLFNY